MWGQSIRWTTSIMCKREKWQEGIPRAPEQSAPLVEHISARQVHTVVVSHASTHKLENAKSPNLGYPRKKIWACTDVQQFNTKGMHMRRGDERTRTTEQVKACWATAISLLISAHCLQFTRTVDSWNFPLGLRSGRTDQSGRERACSTSVLFYLFLSHYSATLLAPSSRPVYGTQMGVETHGVQDVQKEKTSEAKVKENGFYHAIERRNKPLKQHNDHEVKEPKMKEETNWWAR